MTLSPLLLLHLPMLHLEGYEGPLELEISFEPVLKKRNYMKSLLATSFFEIVLFFVYLEYD